MKKIDLGQMMGILANVGVIAGIVFLAFELRQNNDLLASQARSNLTTATESYLQNVVANAGGIADIIIKVQTEELSSVERFRLNVHWALLLTNWESMYAEVEAGPLVENNIPILLWARTLAGNPDLRDSWEVSKENRSAGFVRFIEEQVLTYLSE